MFLFSLFPGSERCKFENYSFRNPKTIIWVICIWKITKKYGVLRGPQLGKERWWGRLGILRVNTPTITLFHLVSHYCNHPINISTLYHVSHPRLCKRAARAPRTPPHNEILIRFNTRYRSTKSMSYLRVQQWSGWAVWCDVTWLYGTQSAACLRIPRVWLTWP
jgi:hypothetical protein